MQLTTSDADIFTISHNEKQSINQMKGFINLARQVILYRIPAVDANDRHNGFGQVKYKHMAQHSRVVFRCQNLAGVTLPSHGVLMSIGCGDIINNFHVYIQEDKTDGFKFELYVRLHYAVPYRKLAKAILIFQQYTFAGDNKVHRRHVLHGRLHHDDILAQMRRKAGNQPMRYLIQAQFPMPPSMYPVTESGTSANNVCVMTSQSGNQEQVQIDEIQQANHALLCIIRTHTTVAGTFQIDKFAVDCVNVFRNIVALSNAVNLLQLRNVYSKHEKFLQARLLDQDVIIQDIWSTAVDHQLASLPPAIRNLFSQQQRIILYTQNYQQLRDIFNQYVIQNFGLCAQPHPLRILLKTGTMFGTIPSFDLSTYQFAQSTLNIVITSMLVGKNFLQRDERASNDMGAICLCGTPGSGKSKLVEIISYFFDGFIMQDNGKGATEFQNRDILHKSMIRCEELPIQRMLSSEWKTLADMEMPIKMRVKNKEDIEVSKCMPVVATSNSDPFEILFSTYIKDNEEQDASRVHNIRAAARRWAFIRYTDSWNDAHGYVASQPDTNAYNDHYFCDTANQQLMQAMLALAIVNPQYDFLDLPQAAQMYADILLKFSKTLFGQVFFKNYERFNTIVVNVINVYNKDTTHLCHKAQMAAQVQYDVLVRAYIQNLLSLLNNNHLQELYASASPTYYICYRLLQNKDFKNLLEKQSVPLLRDFMSHIQTYESKSILLYKKITECLNFTLLCAENIDMQCGDENSFDAFTSQRDCFDDFDYSSIFATTGASLPHLQQFSDTDNMAMKLTNECGDILWENCFREQF